MIWRIFDRDSQLGKLADRNLVCCFNIYLKRTLDSSHAISSFLFFYSLSNLVTIDVFSKLLEVWSISIVSALDWCRIRMHSAQQVFWVMVWEGLWGCWHGYSWKHLFKGHTLIIVKTVFDCSSSFKILLCCHHFHKVVSDILQRKRRKSFVNKFILKEKSEYNCIIFGQKVTRWHF